MATVSWNPVTDGPRSPEQIADLLALTQEKLIKRGTLVNLMTDLTEFVGYKNLLKAKEVAFAGGLKWRFDVIVDHNHTAKHTKLYDTDVSNEVEATTKGEVGPRYTTANYTYDLREPELQSTSKEVIVKYVLKKNMQMRQAHAELMEADVWGGPATATDDTTPFGFKYWFTPQSAANFALHPNGDFDGVDPMLKKSDTDQTLVAVARAGVTSSQYSRFANWACRYKAVSKEDLIFKMRRAVRRTNFRSPIQTTPEPTLSTGFGIYTTDDVITTMEDILERQNMNLGNDVASKDGKCVFKGHPLVYVPYLDKNADQPLYMIDCKTVGFGVNPGWLEKTSKPMEVPNMHNVRRVFLDSGWNMVCTNLRRNAVFTLDHA